MNSPNDRQLQPLGMGTAKPFNLARPINEHSETNTAAKTSVSGFPRL